MYGHETAATKHDSRLQRQRQNSKLGLLNLAAVLVCVFVHVLVFMLVLVFVAVFVDLRMSVHMHAVLRCELFKSALSGFGVVQQILLLVCVCVIVCVIVRVIVLVCMPCVLAIAVAAVVNVHLRVHARLPRRVWLAHHNVHFLVLARVQSLLALTQG